jgi:hypothetical protein
MPKYCINHSNRRVFSHGLCITCYKRDVLYPKYKLKEKKTYAIKSYSLKRERLNLVYTIKKKEKWAQLVSEGKNVCYFTNVKLDPEVLPDFHHSIGRDGDLLTDMDYAFPATFKAHRDYHDLKYDYEHLEKIPWYKDFLLRLKKNNPLLYEKEMYRIRKANTKVNRWQSM